MADAMATALAAIEQREGKRRGWGKPARLFTVHLADLDTRSVELRVVPARLWGSQVRNPAVAITHTARRLPAVLTTVKHRSYADAPVAGIAVMLEGWGRPADREPTGSKAASSTPWTSTRRSSTSDAAAATSHEPHVLSTAQHDQTTVGAGLVPLGLGRIAHALREGHPVF
ncbi:hypothetical protein GCM10010519_01270 [Streptomyces lactacystinicus]|uniref:Uncharacterized protein n=1 Tax=Streptomyces kaniharaensis TaxID=212423 RepID=A0A6N7L2A2_9ACTN|nr:hypothetical protein [Streptomyces kaniharaensis]MQS17325.1 hypothetical protein [Streptomyces kaniharaensis]